MFPNPAMAGEKRKPLLEPSGGRGQRNGGKKAPPRAGDHVFPPENTGTAESKANPSRNWE